MSATIRPLPARRRPVQVALAADGVGIVDERGGQRWWPRPAVGRVRLVSAGITGTGPDGIRVPLATGLAVDGVDGAELARLPWWGLRHEPLEQAAAAAGIPLVYAEGPRRTVGGEPVPHRPRWREPTPVALLLGPAEVVVTDRAGHRAAWPRIGHRPAGGWPLAAADGQPAAPVARLRLYRDYNTGSWLKAVSLVDPWRHELVLVRWDTLRGSAPMHEAACAAGLLPEFCWESGLPERVGVGRVPLLV